MFNLRPANKETLKNRIAEILSDIQSAKHDCKITYQFVQKEEKEETKVG